MKAKYWIKNQITGNTPPEILCYGEIGDPENGITSKQFIEKFKALNAPEIVIRINSAGGDAFEALAIYSWVRSQKTTAVTAFIDGLCASCATIIACAASNIIMSANASYVVHNPWGQVSGDDIELQKGADRLKAMKQTFISEYVNRTGLPASEILRMMAAETWIDAQTAQLMGFVDFIGDALEVAALIPIFAKSETFKTFAKVPDTIQSIIKNKEKSQMELDTIKAELATRKTELETVNALVLAKDAELARINASLAAKDGELTTLKASLTAKDADLSTVKASLVAVETELTTKKTELEASKTDLVAKDGVIEANKAEIATLNGKVSAYETAQSGFRPIGSDTPKGMDAVQSKMQKSLDKLEIK